MEKSIAAAEANRRFSQVLRNVRQGRSYTVTSHGKPVARIVPVTGPDRVSARAKDALLAHLESLPVVDIGPWKRDELYERDR
ncbi:MAG TPA: type II toxin-antitoxin system prevent-host-death family antitoxin [Candidatus Tyrphobacter sp.]